MTRSGETGIALVVAMFMVLVLSVIGSSLIFVSRTETLSSLNYKTMTQTRYGAESAVHAAANYLVWTYQSPGTPTDPLANYTTTVSPVQYDGQPVVLSSREDDEGNYPDATVRTAFYNAARGLVTVSNSSVSYDAQATLLSVTPFVDSMTGAASSVETWEITGRGSLNGVASAQVEVSAVIERRQVPLYQYAAFATASGCGALSFAGGATTDSYDSRDALVGGAPVRADYGGNVGTNGNLNEAGNPTTIHGSLSSPRTGVGVCGAGNVTALTTAGGASVEGGIVELPQQLDFPTPPVMNPLPPTTNMSFGSGCPAGVLYCAAAAGGATITPPTSTSVVRLGNVSLVSHDVLTLNAGIYEINSISSSGHGSIVVGTGPVIIKVAGTNVATPIDLTGGSVVNGSFDAAKLQFIYGGTGSVKLRGNSSFAAVVYAPNASTSFAGQGDFYGAIVTKHLTATGGADIHYDRNLENGGKTRGNVVMSSFTWSSK